MSEMKIFYLKRGNDIVAYGCVFPNGKCSVAWEGVHRSVVVWDSFEDLEAVNMHPGTECVYIILR